MSHIFFCGLSTSVIFFFTISHKRYGFRKKLMNIKCVCLIFCTSLSQTFIILRRTERVMIKNVYRSSCNVPVILVRVEFSRQIKKKKSAQMWNFIKIGPVRDEMFHADGGTGSYRQTDRHDETNSRFSQFFACAQKKWKSTLISETIHSTIETATTVSTRTFVWELT